MTIRSVFIPAVVLALALCSLACTGVSAPESKRPPLAEKWYQRAAEEFQSARIDQASDSAQRALDIVPNDADVRVLAARTALARLEFDEALRLTRGLQSSDAAAVRGRAHWYKGDLERAADELESVLADPDVDDGWAKQIAKLARRGQGRRPFAVSGGLVAQVDMPRLGRRIPFYVVPVEIDGDQALAMVSTGTAEVVLDSATRREPSWVSLRFAKRLEVKDVPALTEDLTALSHQLGAPIKALLGANLLRHLNATLDRRGRQFVARSFVPPPPPVASRVDLFYLRGGGMVMGGALGDDVPAALYVDSSMAYPIALDRAGWKKVGVDATTLPAVAGASDELRSGSIPLLQFGAFKLPQIPGVYGSRLGAIEQELSIDLDGAVGAGLLADFRLTFSDGGRVLWVEQSPSLALAPPRADLSQPLTPIPAGSTALPGAADPLAPPLGGALLPSSTPLVPELKSGEVPPRPPEKSP